MNEQATAYIAGFRYGLDVGLGIGEGFTVWAPQPVAPADTQELARLRETVGSQGSLIVLLRRRNDWLSHLVGCPECYGYARGEPEMTRCATGAPLYQALRDLETTRFEEGQAHVQDPA